MAPFIRVRQIKEKYYFNSLNYEAIHFPPYIGELIFHEVRSLKHIQTGKMLNDAGNVKTKNNVVRITPNCLFYTFERHIVFAVMENSL